MSFVTFFEKNRILLLDGATGSQLIERGLSAGECPELWNVTHPGAVRDIALSYFNAGSDAVLTNTFGGSFLKLKNYGLEERVHELNYAGARNALEVRPAGKFVIASVGPSGAMLEPFGEVSEEEMTESFLQQVKALAEAGVDAFLLETFTDTRELVCAANAIKQCCQLPFIASMTFTKSPAGYHTIMGTSIEEATSVILDSGAFAIGSNCGNGIHNMIEVGSELRKSAPFARIMVKPNAGEPVLKDGCTCYAEDASAFQDHFAGLLSFNPSFLGGCCGTNPGHIEVLRKLIDTLQ